MNRAEQRDRIVITLEQRQLFFVLMGILVLASGILVLGYAVGQRLAARIDSGEMGDPAALELSALDPGEHPKPQLELTFDETLKISAPSVGRLERKAVAKVKPKKAPAKAAKIAKPAPKSATARPLKAAQDSTAKPKPKAKTSAAVKAETVAAEALEVLRRLRRNNAATPQAGAKAQAATAASSSKLANKGDAAAARPGKADRQRRNGERYTIQVSAFQERNEAMDMVRRLRRKGHNPYLVLSDIPGRGRWYRVRVGKFATRKTASEYQRRLRKVKGLQPFISEI